MMPRRTSYCLGCEEFKSLTPFRVLPKEFKHCRPFPICFTCRDKIKKIIALAERRNGRYKRRKVLEMPRYYEILRDFIMGRK